MGAQIKGLSEVNVGIKNTVGVAEQCKITENTPIIPSWLVDIYSKAGISDITVTL